VKFSSSKRRWIAAATILLLLFLLRPGASRLKSRIAMSLSSGVGRTVEVGSVHLRLLPRPGFDLENLVVYDDPAFGAEPMLRASEVTAALRLTSLVRGRLEIARLDLTEPSLNLVHGDNGRWNLEALLERTAHTPLAPTAKAKLEPRPGFPYIEATSARINFKNGPEKKPYALTNADFSLWQDSENTWGVRLKAQPMRSDLNLNDTGVLRVNGTWQRAATLRETPLQFSVEWDRPQLGQLTKLFSGNDQGWRGGMQLEATLAGTPAKLTISTSVSIQDFRRYDITAGDALRLAVHCDGKYSSLDHVLREVACNAPVGSGLIVLKGELGLPGSHRYGLVLAAQDVPVSAAVALARRAKKNLPDDLIARGLVRGSVTIDEGAPQKLRLEGQGEITGFGLASVADNAEIGPQTVPFVFASGDARQSGKSAHKNASVLKFPEGPHVEFGPFPVAIGRAVATPMARGWVNRSGYGIALAGEAEVAKALRVSRMLGLPVLNATADGAAQLDLLIAGTWPNWSNGTHSDFLGPQITGTAKLRNVRVPVRGTSEPVEIASADMHLVSDQVRVEKLSAIAANTSWTGSLEMPRGCGTPGVCEVRFNLTANRIALGELSAWARPSEKERPWYRMLESNAQAGPTVLGSLRAAGHVTVDRLQVHNLAAARVSASLSLDRGKLRVSELNADFLGGRYRGSWQADFTVKPAVCSGGGSLSGVLLARVADSTKDPWISGTANGAYQVSGSCAAGFWTSAEGTVQFDVRNGTLPHISLAEDEGSLQIARLTGQARLHGGKLEVKEAKLDSPGGRFQLSGTASLKRDLDLKLARFPLGMAQGYTITGTLAQPRVVPLPGAEQARLKP
jgi:AsmA-like protein